MSQKQILIIESSLVKLDRLGNKVETMFKITNETISFKNNAEFIEIKLSEIKHHYTEHPVFKSPRLYIVTQESTIELHSNEAKILASSLSTAIASYKPPKEEVRAFETRNAGISGLLKNIEVTAQRNDETLESGLKDLSSLRENAQSLASFSAKLCRDFPEIQLSTISAEFVANYSQKSSSEQKTLILQEKLLTYLSSNFSMNLSQVFLFMNRGRINDLLSFSEILEILKAMEKVVVLEFGSLKIVVTAENATKFETLVLAQLPADQYRIAPIWNISADDMRVILMTMAEKGKVLCDITEYGDYFYPSNGDEFI